MGRSRKVLAVAGVALALAVGGGSALAFGSAEDAEALLGDIAGRLGVGQEELEQAIRDAQAAQVDAAEAAGELTADEAAALRERIQSAETPLLGGPGFHRHGPGHGFRGGLIEPAAEALGLTGAELRERLPGSSLAAIAEEQGVQVGDVEQAIVAGLRERLDDALADGRLTEEQAGERARELEARVGDLVTRVFPEEGAFGRFHHGFPPPTGEESGGASDGAAEAKTAVA